MPINKIRTETQWKKIKHEFDCIRFSLVQNNYLWMV